MIPTSILIQVGPSGFLRLEGPFKCLEKFEGECIVYGLPDKTITILKPNRVDYLENYNFNIFGFEPVRLTPFKVYAEIFTKAINGLNSGLFKKIVLTVVEEGRVFPKLKKKSIPINNHSFFYNLNFNNFDFIGFSPDPFLFQDEDGRVTIRITAGTSNSVDDLPQGEMEISLQNYPQWTLHKCETVEAGGLFHIRSVLTAPFNCISLEHLERIYPPETIFGYPYESVLLFKDKLNPVEFPWGALVGYRGYLPDHQLFRSIICIRGAFIYDSGWYKIIAGSGIIPGYSAEKEYDECRKKIESVKRMLGES